MILLWLGCARTLQPVGPTVLACAGQTAILVDPDPWAEIGTVRLTVDGRAAKGLPGEPIIVVPDELASRPLTLQLDDHTCTLRPGARGGETGVCDGVGIALHYTPLCELSPTRRILASSETLVIDPTKNCLIDTRAYRDVQDNGPNHQTCGGRPPGDSLPGVIEAVPTTAAFPWLR